MALMQTRPHSTILQDILGRHQGKPNGIKRMMAQEENEFSPPLPQRTVEEFHPLTKMSKLKHEILQDRHAKKPSGFLCYWIMNKMSYNEVR